MAKSKAFSVRKTRFNDSIDIEVKSHFGNCLVKLENDVAEIIKFTACGEKPDLLKRTLEELGQCKIVAYVNHSDLRIFAEQGFEATEDLVPPPMGGYGIRQLTTRMIRSAHAS